MSTVVAFFLSGYVLSLYFSLRFTNLFSLPNLSRASNSRPTVCDAVWYHCLFHFPLLCAIFPNSWSFKYIILSLFPWDLLMLTSDRCMAFPRPPGAETRSHQESSPQTSPATPNELYQMHVNSVQCPLPLSSTVLQCAPSSLFHSSE